MQQQRPHPQPLIAALIIWLLLTFAVAPPGTIIGPLRATASALQTADEPVHVGALAPGASLFWDGAYVESARLQPQGPTYFFERFTAPNRAAASDPCVTKTSPCWLYSFDVPESSEGQELRVSLNSATKKDCFGFELIDPAGVQHSFPIICPLARGMRVTPHVFSSEIFDVETFVRAPTPGRWQVKVVVGDVDDWAFRMRAALQEKKEEPLLLAPNLVAWLPYEFGFVAPASPRSGTSRDNINPPGSRPVSCTWEETLNDGATNCLRFSSGLHNIGDGPLYLDFSDEQRARQHTYYSDDSPGNYADNEESGNYLETEAGSGEYHAAHEHLHAKDMVLFELFEVADPSPAPPYDPSGKRLKLVGTGAKHGFCTFDHQMGRWHELNQDRHATIYRQVGGDCIDSMALDKGWGDLYYWKVPGQYVDYRSVAQSDGSMVPGYYLVRVTIDPENHILESNDEDNRGWALIRVIEDVLRGDRVVICDRGFGASPWHPRRERAVEPFWWTLQRASQAPRDGECDGVSSKRRP